VQIAPASKAFSAAGYPLVAKVVRHQICIFDCTEIVRNVQCFTFESKDLAVEIWRIDRRHRNIRRPPRIPPVGCLRVEIAKLTA